jgi:hypothetical protein
VACCETAAAEGSFAPYFDGDGVLRMTRFSAAAAISIFLALFTSLPAPAQSGQYTPDGPPAADNPVCNGGSMTDGRCACPAGFDLLANGDNTGGVCVRSHAENCLGGELTVDGKCLCTGQVVMSGETYLLEYSRGKCLPKQCPVQTLFKDGRCVATSASSPDTSPEFAGGSRPAPPKEPQEEEAQNEASHRYPCGRGTVRTRSGCASVHRRASRYSISAGSLRRYYYRMRYPAYAY